jgi:hypothetical protein
VLALALHFDAKPRHAILDAVPDTLRVFVALAVLFGLTGFGLVRLLLPPRLARYELLWVLPAGGCVTGLALTVLGFAGVPYPVALALVGLAGLAVSTSAVRSRGWPAVERAAVAWPAYTGVLVFAVALIPMLAVQHFAAPVGTGSDAHVAAGAANFLQHSYPTSVNLHTPINQMPQPWRSKYPIYYAFGGVSTLSGLHTWQVLAPMADILLGLSAVGFFLVAVCVFEAPVAVGLVAMGLAALDRMALHTVIHPYFNQTWGFFALPFTLALSWEVVQPGRTRPVRTRTAILLAIFLAVLVLAYPLAAPLPLVPLLVFLFSAWRRRVRAGERVRIRDMYRGRRSLLWMIPVIAGLAVPVYGVAEKVAAAISVLEPGHSLASWGGDLTGFIPFDQFFSLPHGVEGAVLAVIVAGLAVLGLRRREAALRWGLGGLLVLGIALAVYLRHRPHGFYFHFKLLAFVGPLVMLIAAVGAGRLRRAGPVLLAVLAACTIYSAEREIRFNGLQMPTAALALPQWTRALPPHATVRLDMPGPLQIWVAYFMDARPLCSMLPLIRTDYPHVQFSRKADYILAAVATGRPADAIGPPLRRNNGFWLFRENPRVPGPNLCTYRRFDRIYPPPGHEPV